MLGGSVGRSIACGEFALYAGDAHNLAALVLDHVAEEALDVTVGPVDINVEHTKMILEIIVFELAAHGNTCVFDHHVQSPTMALQLPNHLFSDDLNLFIITHVQFEHLHLLLILAAAFDSFQLLDVSG